MKDRAGVGGMGVTARAATGFAFDGGFVLVDEDRGRVFVHEGEAALLWEAIAAGASPAEVRAEVARGGLQAAAAAGVLLGQWEREGLLEPHRPAAPASPLDPLESDLPTSVWQSRIGARRIGFAVGPPEVARQLRYILGAVDADRETDAQIAVEAQRDGRMVARCGQAEIVRTADEGLLRGAIYKACLDLLYDAPDWRALVHGAAVGAAGRAVALAAPSGSGKTTLSAWLVAHGFDYLADDLVAVLPDGRVAPWPLPISVKTGSVPLLAAAWPGLAESPPLVSNGRTIRMIEAPRSSWTLGPVPLAMFVFPRFDSAGDGVARRLRPLHCFARLASDRVWMGFPITRARVESFLAWLEKIPAFAIEYADLDTAQAAIRDLLNDTDMGSVGEI